MSRKFLPAAIATVCAFIAPTATSQTAPLVETRGVWFATVLGDGGWPDFAGDSPENQAADLRARIREAHGLGLNTFVFQTVARGDAMHVSDRLPWSARLNGAGQDPGYDPLQVAVEESHKLGMELHAWINVFRVGDIGTVGVFEPLSSPGHVYYEHPEWVVNYNGQLWVDPSSAEARAWLVGNVMEIVNDYDVDAVHFDFIRYPSLGLINDLANFQFDSRGFDDIDDWRRDNVTLFVNEVNNLITMAKPWVKVGSAPFGNYEYFDGAWPAAWAYSEVYQESRRWLAEGTNDYVAPQIYFDIGRDPIPPNAYDSPDFQYLVDDWVAHSSNRPIFVGHGPYQPYVLEELDTQIQYARTAGAKGQIFFRFDHIRHFDFSLAYPTAALPAAMPHRFEATAPDVPIDLAVTAAAAGADSTRFTLTWQRPSATIADPQRGYAIFAASDRDPVIDVAGDATDYTRFVPVGGLSYVETVANADVAARRFAVASVSRLGMMSAPTAIVEGTVVGVEDSDRRDQALRIAGIWPQPANQLINVQFSSRDSGTPISWTVLDMTGRRISNGSTYSSTTVQLDVTDLPTGVYVLIAESTSGVDNRQFVVVR